MENTCECIRDVNLELANRHKNTQLCLPALWGRDGKIKASRVMIKTERVDAKKRQITNMILASYCPFCGKKYIQEGE